MYIEQTIGYHAGTEQRTSRARFLLLLQQESEPIGAANTFAVVRRVALHQLGHFMMGHANLGGRWTSISGSYGNDGLPLTVKSIPEDAKPLPADLYEAWTHGGGWNSAGSEAQAMHAWANKEFRP